MKELLTSLEGLGFTTLECKIYLSLLEYGPMSPYQIAKKIDDYPPHTRDFSRE